MDNKLLCPYVFWVPEHESHASIDILALIFGGVGEPLPYLFNIYTR